MKERIRCIMEYVQLTQQDFAAKLNISPASLSGIFTGRTNPTNNHVMAIHRAFPNININWLMFGEGTMLEDPLGINTSIDGMDCSSDLIEDMNKNTQDKTNVNTSSVNDLPYDSSMGQKNGMASSGPDAIAASYYGGNSATIHTVDYLTRSKILEKRERKIKEIRVFYDDGTYESFVPSNK